MGVIIMRLKMENIGIIDYADIKLEGVTVIAGANSSGKSTVGKIVYAMATGLAESTPLKLLIEKISSINYEVRNIVKRRNISLEVHVIVEDIIDYIEEVSYSVSIFENQPVSNEEIENADANFSKRIIILVDEILAAINKGEIAIENDEDNDDDDLFVDVEDFLLNFDLDNIYEIASRSVYEKKLKYIVYQNVFNSEFNSQIMNITSDNLISKIQFTELNNNKVDLVFNDNKIDVVVSDININREFVRPIYIDNPAIIDELSDNSRSTVANSNKRYNHRWHLYNVLRNANLNGNIFSKEKNDKLISIILNEIINGNIMINGRKSYYELSNAPKGSRLSLSNLSTGMKSFSILAILKDSGIFDEIEYVILDEPEIHLHPEWQLKYAELIVLLSKYLNIKFLVTSHSPYFVEAIELYSKKHQMEQKINYYKSIQKHSSNHFEIIDCTEKLDLIYDEMANALFTLEELRNLVEGDDD